MTLSGKTASSKRLGGGGMLFLFAMVVFSLYISWMHWRDRHLEAVLTVNWTRPSASDPDQLLPIVYADRNLRTGQRIRHGDVVIKQVPAAYAPKHACATSLAEAIGTVVREDIYQGEPIVAQRVDSLAAWPGVSYAIADGAYGVPIAVTGLAAHRPTANESVLVEVGGTQLKELRLLFCDGQGHAVVQCQAAELSPLLQACSRGPLQLRMRRSAAKQNTEQAKEVRKTVHPVQPVRGKKTYRARVVVCFREMLPDGYRLRERDFRYEKVPEEVLPRYCPLEMKDVVGKYVRARMLADEIVSLQRLCDGEDARLTTEKVLVDGPLTTVRVRNAAAAARVLVRGEGAAVYSLQGGSWKGYVRA